MIAQQSPLRSLDFAALRVKDAVCDRFIKETNRRPSVDKRHPDVQIVVYVDSNQVVWYLDTSGDPLFKRGWRKDMGKAPIRENLAAGILRLTGWTGNQTLLDPMCGSGTFLIEAALMAKGIAPGEGRDFAFRHFRKFNHNDWEVESAQSTQTAMIPSLSLVGYDRDPLAAERARLHGNHLGLKGLSVEEGDVLNLIPPTAPGIIVTNPPYGVRCGESSELANWYPKLGDVLKQRFAGWRVYIFSADSRLPKLMRLAPSRKIPLFNGALESRLYEFMMVKGGHRKSARRIKQTQRILRGEADQPY